MFTTIQKEENALRLIFFYEKKILQGACADVFTRPTLLGYHANGRFAGHRTKEMLALAGPNVDRFQTVRNKSNIVVVNERTQQVTTLLGPTMLSVVGQQCCVRLHGP